MRVSVSVSMAVVMIMIVWRVFGLWMEEEGRVFGKILYRRTHNVA